MGKSNLNVKSGGQFLNSSLIVVPGKGASLLGHKMLDAGYVAFPTGTDSRKYKKVLKDELGIL